MNRNIKCPTCGKTLAWDETNPSRPFCSQRCKLIDLGEWASETHRITGESIPSELLDKDADKH